MRLRVFSPNKSCALLREVPMKHRVLLRLGSTTPLISKYKYLEINSTDGIRTSANKIFMKTAFDKALINHSEWINSSQKDKIVEFFNQHQIIIAKHKHSSKGNDIYYIDHLDALNDLFNHINIKDFIFEKYYFFSNEYRMHVDVNHGCFYACKKVLKEDAEVQWHKHANNSTFVILNANSKYPQCWNDIVNDCINVLKKMNLTIACFDVLGSDTNFIIVESNTAPSLATYGINFYINHIKKYYDI